jgi:hypothetical protein
MWSNRISRLNVDRAPKMRVIGVKRIPSSGEAVLFIRLTPCG